MLRQRWLYQTTIDVAWQPAESLLLVTLLALYLADAAKSIPVDAPCAPHLVAKSSRHGTVPEMAIQMLERPCVEQVHVPSLTPLLIRCLVPTLSLQKDVML